MNIHFRIAPAVAILLSLAVMTATAQDKKAPVGKKPAVAENYYPLLPGNQWTYTVNVAEKSVTVVARVAKLEKLDGVEMARLESTVNGAVSSTEHLTQTSQGVFRHRFNGQEVDPPLCLLKYPTKPGAKWNSELKIGAETCKCTCETGEDTVEVPAGKFKTIRSNIRIEIKGQEINTTYWFAKDVGYVKQIADVGGVTVEAVLEKFEPAKVAPKKEKATVGDKAVAPFNGKDLSGWKLKGDAKKSKWDVGTATINDKGALAFTKGSGELVNTAGSGVDIYTEQEFGDCRVEVEVMVPKGSNSGIYLMGRYEVQVFDSFGKKNLTGGDMGAIYSIAVPKINACKKAGEWQKYVIDFQAPRFDGKKKIANANFKKVVLNDQVIHENAEVLKGATGGALMNNEVPVGPLLFQGDHGTVAFRNLRITPMK